MKIGTVILSIVAFVVIVSLIYVGPSLVSGSTLILTVMSDSMSPAIGVGDAVIIESVDPADIRVGDIITYAPREYGIVITHRVVDIGTDGNFITQGDAVADVDINPVKPDQVIGKHAMTIPMLGYVFHYVRQPLGFLVMVIIPAVLLIGCELKSIIIRAKGERGADE